MLYSGVAQAPLSQEVSSAETFLGLSFGDPAMSFIVI